MCFFLLLRATAVGGFDFYFGELFYDYLFLRSNLLGSLFCFRRCWDQKKSSSGSFEGMVTNYAYGFGPK